MNFIRKIFKNKNTTKSSGKLADHIEMYLKGHHISNNVFRAYPHTCLVVEELAFLSGYPSYDSYKIREYYWDNYFNAEHKAWPGSPCLSASLRIDEIKNLRVEALKAFKKDLLSNGEVWIKL